MTTCTEAIPADAVEQTVSLVFQTFLEQEAYPLGPGLLDESELTGCVTMTADRIWSLYLEASLPVARRLAGRFLAQDPEVIVPEDVRDAIGEITNMIAGNFKSAFVPGAKLSVPPLVTDGASSLAGGQCFACDDGVFRVTLLA